MHKFVQKLSKRIIPILPEASVIAFLLLLNFVTTKKSQDKKEQTISRPIKALRQSTRQLTKQMSKFMSGFINNGESPEDDEKTRRYSQQEIYATSTPTAKPIYPRWQ